MISKLAFRAIKPFFLLLLITSNCVAFANTLKEVIPYPQVPEVTSTISESILGPERILASFSKARFNLLLRNSESAVEAIDETIAMIDRVKLNTNRSAYNSKNHLEAISAVYERNDKKINIIVPINGKISNIALADRAIYKQYNEMPKLTNLEHVLINIHFSYDNAKLDLEKIKILIQAESYDQAENLFKSLQDRDIGYFDAGDLVYFKALNNLKLAKLLLKNGYTQETRHALKHVKENLALHEELYKKRKPMVEESKNIRDQIEEISEQLWRSPELNIQVSAIDLFDKWYKQITLWKF